MSILEQAESRGKLRPTAAAESGQTAAAQAMRVMMIRSVSGAGGGADKIILRTAARAQPQDLKASICVIHRTRDLEFDYPQRAERVGAELYTVPERWPFDPQVYRRLQDIALRGQFDILHSHDYKADHYAARLGSKLKIPMVATAHGWTGHTLRERRLYYPANRRLLRRFDAVVCVSSDIKNTLLANGATGDRLHVILNGVDPEAYQRCEKARNLIRAELGLQPDDVVFGSVGRVERQKRFDLLIEAFSALTKSRPDIRLIIVGAGSLLPQHERHLRQLGLSDRCQLLGYRNDMKRLYQAFDVYVQSSDYEGTPTVLLEAMAMKLPIVATDAGGTTELLDPGIDAIVTPPGDVPALAAAMEQTIDDRTATSDRVARAHAKASNELSFEQRTTRLLEVYRHVLESRRK